MFGGHISWQPQVMEIRMHLAGGGAILLALGMEVRAGAAREEGGEFS